MNRARKSITSLGIAVLFAACGSSGTTTPSQTGSSGGSSATSSGGAAGNASGGASGTSNGGAGETSNGGSSGDSGGNNSGSGGNSGGSGDSQTGGSGGNAGGGSGGKSSGGSGGNAGGGSGGNAGGGSGGNASGGSTGPAAGGNTTSAGGKGGPTGGTTSTGAGGSVAGGTQGAGGSPSTGGATTPSTVLVTSASSAYWKAGTPTEATSGSATVTVNDGTTNQKWEGFGGAFNELGWSYLTTKGMQDQAIQLLFSATDGANFAWGRIPMGASDYGMSRYTLDDTGDDVTPDGTESNRPSADTSLSKFSLDRDGQKLIPYIKAAQAVKSDIRFWASPWTPPAWMKTGYMKVSGVDRKSAAKKPSYFDGGNMKSDPAILTAYAQYYTKFVQGYKDKGIKIEIVSPQNEPGYDQNYPSCLWDSATYVSWIKTLGQAMSSLDVKVMLGTLSNEGNNGYNDINIANAVLADSTAKGFLAVVGVQWGVLDKVNGGTTFGGLPIWASEHKCGNYPWDSSYKTPAPNDQAYGVESWGYIRDAIKKGKVTAYNAWNMVLDKSGLGIDTSRGWGQDALLVADSGNVNPTPAYYVFRHLSQYVVPGATVVGTTGGDAVAFKNLDGSIVAVAFNSGSANNNYIVKIGGKMFQFAMPASGWATVKYKP